MPCIYALVDPSEPEHFRYVGMSMNDRRPYSHVKESRKAGRHSYLYNWVRSLLVLGRAPVTLILEILPEDTAREAVGEREKHHIREKRSAGHRLTNRTEGGDGGAQDEETLARISQTLKGRKPTAETLAKRSASLKGIVKSQETRDKLSKALKGQKRTAEQRKQLSDAHKGKPLSPEHRASISAANRGKRVGGVTFQTPEARAKTSAKLKGIPKSAETRAKMSLAQYRRHHG